MMARWMKAGVMVTVVVAVLAVSLVLIQGSTEAGGPGGRGRGQGANGAGIGMQNNPSGLPLNLNQCADCTADGTQAMQQRNGGWGQNAAQGSYGQGGYGQANASQLGLNLQTLPAPVPGEVPADVVAALDGLWQDEGHAYATYQAVIDQFGAVAPFVNIQRAEAQHRAALEVLYDRYGLTVPSAQPVSTPVFASLQDACAAAAAAEIANFGLYDQALVTVQNYPDMTQVFTALRDASEFSHLPAFQNCAG